MSPVSPAPAAESGRAFALVPPGVPNPNAVPPETVLLGLPIVRRTVLCAQRAGYARIVVPGATPAAPAAATGTTTPAGPGSGAAEVPAASVPAPAESADLPDPDVEDVEVTDLLLGADDMTARQIRYIRDVLTDYGVERGFVAEGRR